MPHSLSSRIGRRSRWLQPCREPRHDGPSLRLVERVQVLRNEAVRLLDGGPVLGQPLDGLALLFGEGSGGLHALGKGVHIVSVAVVEVRHGQVLDRIAESFLAGLQNRLYALPAA